jgi:SAM-dependent methyltransferase
MEATHRYLDGSYVDANPTFHVEDSPWKAQQVAKFIDRQRLSLQSMCDVGCGAGEVLRQLQLHYPQMGVLRGYEMSPEGYAMALERQNDTLQFLQEDLFANESAHYDLALCLDVIEHVEDYFQFLRNLSRHADHFVFHIPLDMNVQSVLLAGLIRRARSQWGHIHYFSKDTALAALAENGYQVVDWFYTPNTGNEFTSVVSVVARTVRRLMVPLSPDLAVRVLGGHSLWVYAVRKQG